MTANNQSLNKSSFGNNLVTPKPHDIDSSSTYNVTPQKRQRGRPRKPLFDSTNITHKVHGSLKNTDNQQPSTNKQYLATQSTVVSPILNYQPICIPRTYAYPSNNSKSVHSQTNNLQVVTTTSSNNYK